MTEHAASHAAQVPAGVGEDHAAVEIDVPEPWEPFETKLVLWSISIGVGGLIVLGSLVNIYLLD